MSTKEPLLITGVAQRVGLHLFQVLAGFLAKRDTMELLQDRPVEALTETAAME